MTAYAGEGERPAVWETYEQLKAVFKKELGLGSSQSSTELYYYLYR